jgi:hypothetical protein
MIRPPAPKCGIAHWIAAKTARMLIASVRSNVSI